MLEAFVSGFWQVVAWPAFGYMLVGIFIGFWVGLASRYRRLINPCTDATLLIFDQRTDFRICVSPGNARGNGHHWRSHFNFIRHPWRGFFRRADTRRVSYVEEWRSRASARRGDHSFSLGFSDRRGFISSFDSDYATACIAVRFAGIVHHSDHGHYIYRHTGRSIADQRSAGRWYRADAGSNRRRPADRLTALHFRQSLLVGSARSHSRCCRPVCDS